MMAFTWFLLFFGTAGFLSYRRISLPLSTLTIGLLLAVYSYFGAAIILWKALLWVLFAALLMLNIKALRRPFLTRPMMNFYRKLVPSMSSTEREALEAGSVWWEGELFTGLPDWDKLEKLPAATLSREEQAFIDGPVEELCRMLDDWHITHERGDLPPEVWEFIKKNGFFAMIIPKKYGGLEFSAYGHSQVLIKVASVSATAVSTIAVPNSLGPAELLLHYGTDEQNDRYLPGLASGEEVPCFALTSPRAGSDAASIPDTGIICKDQWEGKEITGIRLTWDKRYITLAPIATVLGLAFRLYDPDHLIGEEEDLGITAALIPTKTKGVVYGRRHLPLNNPFQNGPTSGKNVFVPLDVIIGGPEMAGQGWRMLMEQLAVGRCISLPSNATGGAKAAAYATGAYARIRQQFNLPIGRFEGVSEAIARLTGMTYIMDAGRSVTAAAVGEGAKPSVASAILKYHCTEMGRVVANDAMDVHGGKGVCLGPSNYLARGWQSVPIAITVEGANILTRSLIIFGQGAIRCHPYVLKELEAARNEDRVEGLKNFDEALFGHIGFAISNAVRSISLALTNARYTAVPAEGPTRRYYQHINRYSAAFALAADWAMLTLGGDLKKRELLSARLGDVLSATFLASMVLKHYENQGRPADDLPIVTWACRHLLYTAQEQLHGFLRNFPNRGVATMLRFLVFPRGLTYNAPSDKLGAEVTALMISPSMARERVTHGAYKTADPGNPLGMLQQTMEMAIAAEPVEKMLKQAVRDGKVSSPHPLEQIDEAVIAGVLTEDQAQTLRELDKAVMEVVKVDDFDSHELGTLTAELESSIDQPKDAVA
ncbi:MAG: acyl-CoA dehydrogenase [Gammaproteobacteria bacterium]|nr:acyl-CoA dehydrogenase [Gammaproteobacteria bacterium]